MPPISARSLARALRSLDPTERSAFVADLWAARGYETTVTGTVVTADGDTDRDPIRIACDPSSADGSIDAIVDLDDSTPDLADGRVLDADELRGMLLYAVDRATADELLEAHLDRPLIAEPEPPGLRKRLANWSPRRSVRATLAVLLIVLVAIGAAGGTLPLGDAGPSVESAPVPTESPSTAGAPTVLADSGDDSPQGGGDLFRYPPGLGTSGVTNVTALVAAHQSTLAESAWALQISHDRSHDLVHPFVRWSTAEQTIVRASPTRYRFDVTGDASLGNGSLTKISYVDYGDGDVNYRRLIGLHGNAYERTQLPTPGSPGVFASVSAAYVRRYLTTTETRVEPVRVDNTTRSRVVATGRPTAMARTVANYTAVAVIDRRGVVRELTVSYTLLERAPDPTPNGIATPYASPDDAPTEPVGNVRFTMRFAPIKAAGLTAPSWYDDARDATNGTALGPWPNDPAV